MTEARAPAGGRDDADPVRRAILDDLFTALEDAERRDAQSMLSRLQARHPGHEQTLARLYAAAVEYERLCSSLPGAAPGAPRLLPGDTLGDFTVDGLVAVGGMSEVYRARQRSLGDRVVALKVLLAASPDGRSRERLRDEALALARLHHPSLAEVYGFGEQEGLLFYAMRLVEGPTLAQVLARAAGSGGSSPAWRRAVAGWMVEVADALATVHAAGLVHRDVKPANIVLSGPSPALPTDLAALARLSGTAVLVDFGLVRAVGAQAATLTLQRAATPAYAAPEQLLGYRVDARADVFALGVSLHDLLAVRLPSARAQASAGLPPLRELLPDADPDLAAVVSRACDPQPRWRYADAAVVRDDLRAWLRGAGVSARRAPLPERLVRAARAQPRRFAARIGLAVLGAALAVGGTVVVAGAARSAQAASAAARAGDLLALHDALLRLPPGLDRLLLEGELEPLLPRVRRGDPGDRFVRACARLRLGDTSGALHESACGLRLQGPVAEPALLRQLEVAIEDGSPGRGEELRREALLLAARLFIERPVRSAGDAAACDGLRRRLLAVWHDASAAEDDRLYAVSALTGCARADDVPRLLDDAAAQPPNSEPQRLALLAAEHAVRRAHVTGELARLDPEALWRRFLLDESDWSVAARPPGDSLSFGLGLGVRHVGRALAVVARERGLRLDVRPALTAPLPASPLQDPEWWQGPDAWLVLLAGGSEMEQLVRTPPRAPRSALEAGSWGLLCAAFDDPALREEARRSCALLAGPQDAGRWFEAFGRGLAAGLDERRGVLADVDPDADTLLGVACDDAWRVAGRVEGTLAAPDRIADGWRVMAGWCFVPPEPVLEGLAREVALRAAPWQTDDQPSNGYLRLGNFGTSEVRLVFEVQDDPGVRSWRLRVRDQIGARRYFPYQGRAALELHVDRVAGRASDMLANTEAKWHDFVIPVDRLSPGQHELRLLLGRQSTTTYRLYDVVLERPGPR